MKIAVGMSGGVDSSVSALLLKEEGHEVVGITMILKPAFTKEEKENLYKEANDAAAVCKQIGIEHHVLDMREEFAKDVIDNFVEEYKNGRTPNPCVRCNFAMKFGRMLEFAKSLGCEKMATGHYAKTEEIDGRYLLKRSDSPKDQSYFLYTLTQDMLSHTVFPLLHREKCETRLIAEKYNLSVASKGDSQDICFVKGGDYIAFIKNYAGEIGKKGNFINADGKILGEHKGVHHYTIGQRRGLGIAFGERVFVNKIDATSNTVCLGNLESGQTSEILLKDVNFIPFDTLTNEMKVEVKTRYRAKPVKAKIYPIEDKIKVVFDDIQNFVCKGQSAVLYSGDTVVGGGIII